MSRCIRPDADCEMEIHHFSDASESGYGVVSYARMVGEKITCSFIMSKSRLTPLKAVTIPRLELAAATLAVKIDKIIKHNLDIPVQRTYFWTDSTIVLQLISNKDKIFATFVANRLQAIRDGSSPDEWNYVNTHLNPADDASRGLSSRAQIERTSWIRGPELLWQPPSLWPSRPSDLETVNQIPEEEVKRESRSYTATAEPDNTSDPLIRLMERYSTWNKMKSAVAWLLRFKTALLERVREKNQSTVNVSKSLTVQELKSAECAIVKYIQGETFKEELTTLARPNTNNVKKSSPIYGLEPIMSPGGILHVGGRLRHAPIPEEAKKQMILPSHHVSDLIIQHYHEECGQCGHGGKEHVLSLHGSDNARQARIHIRRCRLLRTIHGDPRS